MQFLQNRQTSAAIQENETDDDTRHFEAKKNLLAAALLVAFSIAIFSPAIGYEFLSYDDDIYVEENIAVQSGLSWQGVVYAFKTFDVATWAPLTWLSYMADTSILGPRPSSYRTTNILLHTAGGVLLFFALRKLLRSFWSSLVIAAIFLVHPLRTESVVWIAERKDVLFGFFWMLGLLLYARFAEKPTIIRYGLVFLCFLCGMISKFMMATFPFVLLLLDFWPLDRAGKTWAELRKRAWPLAQEKIPFVLACLVFMRLTVGALGTTHTLHTVSTGGGGRLLSVLENYAFYVCKIFWPSPRSILYPVANAQPGLVVFGALLLVAITAAGVWRIRKQPWLLVGWLWFIGTLVPVIGFVQFGHFSVADRYTYIPSVGLTIVVVFGIEHLTSSFRFGKVATIIFGAAVVVACLLMTRADLPRWRNSVTLFGDAVRVGYHPVAYGNLASALAERGEYDSAVRYATDLIALRPNNVDGAYNTRGLAYSGKEDFDNAIADFTKAIELKPNFTEAWNNRANAYLAKSDLDSALRDFTKAIELKPDFTEALNNRAYVWSTKGAHEQAIEDCNRSIQINPRSAQAYNNRGNVYSAMQQWQKALADFDKVISLRPGFASGYNNRAAVYVALKDYNRARADLDRCRQLGGKPSAELLKELGELDQPKR